MKKKLFKLFCVCAQWKSEDWKNFNWIISILAKRKTFLTRYGSKEQSFFVNGFFFFQLLMLRRKRRKHTKHRVCKETTYTRRKKTTRKQQEFYLKRIATVWKKNAYGGKKNKTNRKKNSVAVKTLSGEWYTILNWHDTLFSRSLRVTEKNCGKDEVNNKFRKKEKTNSLDASVL